MPFGLIAEREADETLKFYDDIVDTSVCFRR